MGNLKQTVIHDALRLLRESYEDTDTWLLKSPSVSPKHKPAPVISQAIPPTPPPAVILRRASAEKPTPIVPIQIESPTPKAPQALPMEEFFQKMEQSFPKFLLHRSVLSDTTPYLKALEAQVLIISFQESKESDLFLRNIDSAFQAYGLHACFLNASSLQASQALTLLVNQMQAKLLVAPQQILHTPQFRPLLKELPASGLRFFAERALFVLDPISTYLADSGKKKNLWKMLCTLASS